jgi:hypothetical protein
MTQEKVAEVNKLLLAGEPGNISVDDHSDYTGYKPQSVVDAMNTVFWGQWGFEKISSEIVAGDKSGLAVAEVQVWLAGNDFKPTSYGQNRVTRGDIGDARKGAQTDAIKKALSYFSIGNRAYHGLLEKPGQASNTRPAPVRPAQPATNGTSQAPRPTAESMNIANDVMTADQLHAIENMYKQLGKAVPPDVRTLSRLKAEDTIRNLTTDMNLARQKKGANHEKVGAK